MAEYRFERECRTLSSESFIIESDGEEFGRVDIHYTAGAAYATLCLPDGLSEDAIQELIGEVDERLVMTSDPYRDDFIVTVWGGRETGVYSEEGDEEELEEEEVEGNGHRD